MSEHQAVIDELKAIQLLLVEILAETRKLPPEEIGAPTSLVEYGDYEISGFNGGPTPEADQAPLTDASPSWHEDPDEDG